MNVREMRELLAGLPDDYEVVAEAGDGEHFELRRSFVQHPTSRKCGMWYTESPGVVALTGGQGVNLDFNIEDRFETAYSIRGITL